MAMLAGAFASCSKEDISRSPGTEGTQSVTINLVADDAVNTRAAASGISQYIIEAYSDDAYTTPANIFEDNTTNQATSANGSFSLILDRTKEYHCLFWADKDAEAYTTATLKTVTLAPGKTPAEAWFGTQQISGNQPTQTITLKRAVAKLNLLETGKLIAGTTLTATFNQPTEFNVATGRVTSNSESRTETITTSAISGSIDSPVQLGTGYFILSPASTQYVARVTFKCGEEEAFDVFNVPFQANHATNIKGHYTSLASETFNVTCDDDWTSPDEEVDIWDGTTTAQPAGYDAANPGTVDITTAAELAWIPATCSSSTPFTGYTFRLTTDIDLNNHEWKPINDFKGTFDGQSHTISGLKCTDRSNAGLFGKLDGTTVRNVTVGGSITYNGTGMVSAGGIAARAEGTTRIENCTNLCTITVVTNNNYGSVGGIVGNVYIGVNDNEMVLSGNTDRGTITLTGSSYLPGSIVGSASSQAGMSGVKITLTGNHANGNLSPRIIGYCSDYANNSSGAITVDGTAVTNHQPYPVPEP